MIISHEHKFIFLKTRKTAGTSLEIALSQFCGERDIITPINDADENIRKELSYRGPQNFRVLPSEHAPKNERSLSTRRQIGYYNHMPAEQVRSLIGTTLWDEYFKFCFERNPWDRAISIYHWRTREQQPRPSLLEFLRYGSEKVPYKGRKIKLSNFEIYSIDEEIVVDHVGLYENLDSELERIATLLNFPKEINLPRAKGTSREDRRHYRDVMGQEERSIVAQACAREIAHFGYSF
jgi:hypothetical protein